MTPEPLIFPRGVRYPRTDEIPGGAPDNAADRVADSAWTPVTTGYARIDLDGTKGYNAVLEANVHAPDLWRVFTALVARAPCGSRANRSGRTSATWRSQTGRHPRVRRDLRDHGTRDRTAE